MFGKANLRQPALSSGVTLFYLRLLLRASFVLVGLFHLAGDSICFGSSMGCLAC